jgi:hypothetical protein
MLKQNLEALELVLEAAENKDREMVIISHALNLGSYQRAAFGCFIKVKPLFLSSLSETD